MGALLSSALDLASRSFSERKPLESCWQDIAEHFYPDRAEFSASRITPNYSEHLTTSTPVIIATEFANVLEYMLRPFGVQWFSLTSGTEADNSVDGKQYLDNVNAAMRAAMYDPKSGFKRAAKLTDHDLARFGQGVLQVTLNMDGDGLLFRNWHLKDVSWIDDEEGRVCGVFRKWSPKVRYLKSKFKDLHKNVRECRDDNTTVQCYHVEIRSDYVGEESRDGYLSLYIDADNGHIMERVETYQLSYVVPRWALTTASQYAVSPAIIAALPDARLIQAVTLALLESGEKAVNPPLLYQEGAIRGDLALFAGGATPVDMQEMRSVGDAIHSIQIDKSGIGHGMAMREDVSASLRAAFMLNKLDLPPAIGSGGMTATEVMQRVQQYVRDATPLFDPLEDEYNGQLCEKVFAIMQRAGAFGGTDNIPESLQGKDVTFRFTSPLTETLDQRKGALFQQAMGLVAQVAEADPEAVASINFRKARTEALLSLGTPADWLRTDEEIEEMAKAQQQAQQQQQFVQQVMQGAEAAQAVGNAGEALQRLGVQ